MYAWLHSPRRMCWGWSGLSPKWSLKPPQTPNSSSRARVDWSFLPPSQRDDEKMEIIKIACDCVWTRELVFTDDSAQQAIEQQKALPDARLLHTYRYVRNFLKHFALRYKRQRIKKAKKKSISHALVGHRRTSLHSEILWWAPPSSPQGPTNADFCWHTRCLNRARLP